MIWKIDFTLGASGDGGHPFALILYRRVARISISSIQSGEEVLTYVKEGRHRFTVSGSRHHDG